MKLKILLTLSLVLVIFLQKTNTSYANGKFHDKAVQQQGSEDNYIPAPGGYKHGEQPVPPSENSPSTNPSSLQQNTQQNTGQNNQNLDANYGNKNTNIAQNSSTSSQKKSSPFIKIFIFLAVIIVFLIALFYIPSKGFEKEKKS